MPYSVVCYSCVCWACGARSVRRVERRGLDRQRGATDPQAAGGHLGQHAGYRTALLGKAHFDPQEAVKTYAEHLDAWELLDKLGYDTGIKAVHPLDPAREFPADGAAGEGFTNTGNALVMSPALVTKP